nr:hypothetical protein [Tanacetum cinerariifolium]
MMIASKRGAYTIVSNYVRNTWGKYGLGRFSYARAMIEFSVRVELKDNIVATMPKIIGEGYYTSKIYVEYEWKPPRCACCKIFRHVLKECPKNLGVSVTKNLKKTSQTPKGIPVDNDVELDTNEGSTHLAIQEENYSESLFWNAESSSPNTTPIMKKINKMENLIIDGKAILVDNEGKPLSKVDEDSEDEVASVDNDVANFLARNDGYGQEIPKMLQAFCDNLDIKVRGRCALLRGKVEEDLVTYLKYFQDTYESSDESTNVVNAPREPVVVKQDHGVNPSHIDKCCCECGNALDGIFCQQCICKSFGKGAHTGYNCIPKVPIISSPEPCNQTMNNELPQTLPSFDSTCYSDKENLVPCVSKPKFVDESSNTFNPPLQHPIYYCEICVNNTQYGHYCTPQAPFINPEPGYSQDFNFPQNIHDFQQQYLCCDQCGGPHETFQF